jgi:hypothetical protein
MVLINYIAYISIDMNYDTTVFSMFSIFGYYVGIYFPVFTQTQQSSLPTFNFLLVITVRGYLKT